MSYNTIRLILTLSILLFILIIWLKKLFYSFMKKRLALRQYYAIIEGYNSLMEVRKLYYDSRFIEDPNQRELCKHICEDIYNTYLEILENPKSYNFIYLLPQEMKEEIEEILNSPRYKLY